MLVTLMEQAAMLIEPDFLIIFAIVLALTSAVWSTSLANRTHEPSWPRSLAPPRPSLLRPSSIGLQPSSPQPAPRRHVPGKKPTMLAATPVAFGQPLRPVARPVPAIAKPRPCASGAAVPVDNRLSTATQINRLTHIVDAAAETAHAAGRLHRQAHEQVDAAHYALQNLLAELTAVMPVSAPVVTAPKMTLDRAIPTRRVYHTALAA